MRVSGPAFAFEVLDHISERSWITPKRLSASILCDPLEASLALALLGAWGYAHRHPKNGSYRISEQGLLWAIKQSIAQDSVVTVTK